MRTLLITFFIFLFIIINDFLSYLAINLTFNQILNQNIYTKLLFFSFTFITFFFFIKAIIKVYSSDDIFAMNHFYKLTGVLALFYLPKLNISIFYGLAQLSTLIFHSHLFLTDIGFGFATLSFFLVAHGMFINKTKFQIRTQIISSIKIPKTFDHFKIIQISDIHIGSFHKDIKSIPKLVKQINRENPDLILFTGDMVSNYADEIDEFIPTLKSLKSKYGIYSILGNHDYGEYVKWKSKEQEQKNLNSLKTKQKEIGFTLLNNQNTTLKIKDESIQIIGVENWGRPPFPQFGDLDKAIKNLSSEKFTILMSHDPSHWRAKVFKYPFIDLTLSGHTHAMQFGFELGSWQWSPVKYKYPEWGGLYQENKQLLYVNRGTGFLGFPGRIGIRPEITKLILKSE